MNYNPLDRMLLSKKHALLMTSNKIHGSQYSENCLTSPKLLGEVILFFFFQIQQNVYYIKKRNILRWWRNFIRRTSRSCTLVTQETPEGQLTIRYPCLKTKGNRFQSFEKNPKHGILALPGSWATSACLLASNKGIPQHYNDRISPQEHLRDVTVFVDWLGLLLAFPALGHLGPHLLDVL